MRYQLKLGLDLKGGVHLVMRVNTDDALKLTTTSTSEQLRESLRTAGLTVGAITLTAPTKFRVDGVPSDRDSQFRPAADEVAGTSYDRNPLRGRRVRIHDEADRRTRSSRADSRPGAADDRPPRQ